MWYHGHVESKKFKFPEAEYRVVTLGNRDVWAKLEDVDSV